MMGQDPTAVIVRPNLSFLDATLSPQDAQALMAVWQGGGISFETFYENLQRGELASAERTADGELGLIAKDQDRADFGTDEAGLLASPETDPSADVTEDDVRALFAPELVERVLG
jgi:hypothetical protein